MSMFSKLKQFKDLRNQAKTLQNALADISTSLEKNSVKMTMNGNMEITSLTIETDLTKEKTADTMKNLFNDAIKKTQKIMAQKMQEMGGIPGLN